MSAKTAKTEKYPEVVTFRMIEAAIETACAITGNDGYGVRQYRNIGGLVNLVQEYIDTARETKGTGMIAHEDDGLYWIGY